MAKNVYSAVVKESEELSPARLAFHTISGFLWLGLGFLHEVESNPIVPISSALWLLPFAVAAGCGAALLRMRMLFAGVGLFFAALFLIALYVSRNDMSLLPVGLLAGVYSLSIAGIDVQRKLV